MEVSSLLTPSSAIIFGKLKSQVFFSKWKDMRAPAGQRIKQYASLAQDRRPKPVVRSKSSFDQRNCQKPFVQHKQSLCNLLACLCLFVCLLACLLAYLVCLRVCCKHALSKRKGLLTHPWPPVPALGLDRPWARLAAGPASAQWDSRTSCLSRYTIQS